MEHNQLLIDSLTRQTDAINRMAEAINEQAKAIATLGGAIHGLADAIACAVDPDVNDETAAETIQKPRTYLDGTPL